MQLSSSNIVCSVHKISQLNLNFFFLEPPLVRVYHKETVPGITTLYCRAHGFYPPEISMTWMKNGEEMVQEMDYGDILPSGDGTYQTWVSVELDSQSSDVSSCHVKHCGVHTVLQGARVRTGCGCLGVRLRKGGEQEAWIPACFRMGLLHQRFSNLVSGLLSTLKKIIEDPKELCLCSLYLFLLTIL